MPEVLNPPEGLSFGQKAVGLSFNPSGNDEVALAKQECANLIDHMNTLRSLLRVEKQNDYVQ
jgi:hypothetical protein